MQDASIFNHLEWYLDSLEGITSIFCSLQHKLLSLDYILVEDDFAGQLNAVGKNEKNTATGNGNMSHEEGRGRHTFPKHLSLHRSLKVI